MTLLSKDTTRILKKILLIILAISFLGLFAIIVMIIWFPYFEDITLVGKLSGTAIICIIFSGIGLIFLNEKENDDTLKKDKLIN